MGWFFVTIALHELASGQKIGELLGGAAVGYVNATLIVILLTAGISAAFGKVFHAVPATRHDRLMYFSIGITLAAASCYTAIHYIERQ